LVSAPIISTSSSVGVSESTTVSIATSEISVSDSIAATGVPVLSVTPAPIKYYGQIPVITTEDATYGYEYAVDINFSASDGVSVADTGAVNLKNTCIWVTEYTRVQLAAPSLDVSIPTVTDSVHLGESIEADSGACAIYWVCEIIEDVHVSIDEASGDPNVHSGVHLAESVTISIDMGGVSVSDSVHAAESVSLAYEIGPPTRSDSVHIGESIGIYPEPTMNISDAVTVGESCELDIAPTEAKVFDGISVGVAVFANPDELLIGVSDSVLAGELTDVAPGERNAGVSDAVTVGSSVTVGMDRNVEVSDSVTLAEDVEDIYAEPCITVSEAISVGEGIVDVYHPELDILVAQEVTVTDSPSGRSVAVAQAVLSNAGRLARIKQYPVPKFGRKF
jgi:hypothetical protein